MLILKDFSAAIVFTFPSGKKPEVRDLTVMRGKAISIQNTQILTTQMRFELPIVRGGASSTTLVHDHPEWHLHFLILYLLIQSFH
jgi:hypothetical protein